MLRSNVEQLNRLEDMVDGLTAMGETDHADNGFLMEMLTCANTSTDMSSKVISRVPSPLAPNAPMNRKEE